ncbi:MAG: transglutaminase family protein [Solirubrobacteraceae bacterium]
MNFAIRYLSRYEYDAEIVDNLNALRVRPAINSRQRVDEFTVRLSPEVRVHHHDDYFGTDVVEFEISRPHQQLTIDVRARVSTKPPPEPVAASWEALRDPSYVEAGGEFLLQTAGSLIGDGPRHPLFGELLAATREASDPLAAVILLSELIPDRFEYRRGATYVDSSVADLLEGGAGVCQDFVHLGLAILREHGIAARYVSGYLFVSGSAGDGESVEVDTHAWVEALLPDPEGGDPVWVGADPTNRGLAGERHVKIGHGRHYPDVPPIKGVYRGAAEATLSASVTMTRLDKSDPASIARS